MSKRIERLLWPSGRTMTAVPIRLVGLTAERIHIFGDSHTDLFQSLPRAIIHHTVGVTMHRVGRDGAQTFALPTRGIESGDALGFVFGEIDIRVHVANQRDRFFRDPTEILHTLATAYLTTLQAVKRAYPSSPIVVFSVVPPAGRNYPNFNHHKTFFPQIGRDRDRIEWTKQLNRLLRDGAFCVGFGFVDQYSPFVTKRGLLNPRMTADGLHVTPNPPNKDVQELFCVGLTARAEVS